MRDELFAELLESVREGGAILRGETTPSRMFEITAPDVQQIRGQYNLSQSKFAAALWTGGLKPSLQAGEG